MSAPDLLYSEVEEDLRAGVRRLLRDRCDWTSVLARCESDQPYDLDLWRTLAGELGLAALLVPEELGGAGASARELGVVAEELGRAVAPVPFLGNLLATTALTECADAEGVRELLPRLSDGSLVGTVAVPLTTAPHAPFPSAVKAEGATLTGTITSVVDLEVADRVLVPATDEDGPALYLVDTSAAGVTTTPATPLDLTRRIGTLDLSAVVAQRVGGDAVRVLRRALTVAAGTLASEQTGLAQLCLDSTVEYALTRYQFGRQIASFQAVKHRLADLWSGVSTARAAARGAADALTGSGEETELAVAVAQAYCSDLVVLAAEEALQLHGGIGMTWEHPVHLYLGRAKSSQLAFGIAERHRARIAELVGLES
ncbi:acyl-CoA/acyl-ACP dehydrogenase [Saccharopolyspora erythraea]|uniref:acyl-CoA dehydrogenase family protein n=1 Tax=Saccharopolyspora erythraea TaxID=1836 RepID=UPI001BAA8945|nr:acyl-CoA dehydrogenase family protein [Saccharopolyspora erythraea]QUH00584.1 acyl-CoA/acyl-ACP dehydrogenase [Saccharopolyspora erythraea]